MVTKNKNVLSSMKDIFKEHISCAFSCLLYIVAFLAIFLLIAFCCWYCDNKEKEEKRNYYEEHKEEIEQRRKERKEHAEEEKKRRKTYIVGVCSTEQYERKEYCSHMHDQYNTQDGCELSIISREEVESRGFKLCRKCSDIDEEIDYGHQITSYEHIEPPYGEDTYDVTFT